MSAAGTHLPSRCEEAQRNSGTRAIARLRCGTPGFLDGVKGKLRTMRLSVRADPSLVPWYVVMADRNSEKSRRDEVGSGELVARLVQCYSLGICRPDCNPMRNTLVEPETYCTRTLGYGHNCRFSSGRQHCWSPSSNISGGFSVPHGAEEFPYIFSGLSLK